MLKLFDPESFALAISYYKLLPRQALQPLAYFLPLLEIVTAVALWLPSLRSAAWRLASGQFLLFAGAVGSAVGRGLDVSCGCFGGESNVSWFHVAGNLALAAVSFIVSRRDAKSSPITLERLAFLVIISGGLACFHHAARADRPLFAAPRNPGYAQLALLSLEETRALENRPEVIFVDARSARLFSQGSLPGAISIPLHTRVDEKTLARLKASQEVIVFCSSRQCHSSKELAVVLKQRGVTQVKVFPGGIEEWTEAGYRIAAGVETSEVSR